MSPFFIFWSKSKNKVFSVLLKRIRVTEEFRVLAATAMLSARTWVWVHLWPEGFSPVMFLHSPITSQCHVSDQSNLNVMYPTNQISMPCTQPIKSQCHVPHQSNLNVMYPTNQISISCTPPIKSQYHAPNQSNLNIMYPTNQISVSCAPSAPIRKATPEGKKGIKHEFNQSKITS